MFASDWDSFEDEMNVNLETVMGESFSFKPMKQRPNKARQRDGSRPAVTFCGQFCREYQADNFNPSALSTRGLRFTETATRSPELLVRACVIDETQMRQSDIIVREHNGTKYEVSNLEANGHGTVTVKLLEVGLSDITP